MSYLIKGTDDIFMDPTGAVSSCHKVGYKLSFRNRCVICEQCNKRCDIYVPETAEEFAAPEIQSHGMTMWKEYPGKPVATHHPNLLQKEASEQ